MGNSRCTASSLTRPAREREWDYPAGRIARWSQLTEGISVIADPGNSGDVNTIAILVVCCFFIGIARAWDLAGGPSIGITREVTSLVRDHDRGAGPRDEQPPAPSDDLAERGPG